MTAIAVLLTKISNAVRSREKDEPKGAKREQHKCHLKGRAIALGD